MKIVQHWIGGSSTAGTSTRTAPVVDPATGQQQADVLLASLFGDKHIHGPEGITFYTRGKVVTARRPELDEPEEHTGHMHFPVAV